MNRKILHTPEGVRDIYGDEAVRRRSVSGKIRDKLASYGYSEILTPMFEFFDIFADGLSATSSSKLYKFPDPEGNTLVLRPDFTPSVARCVSKYFSEDDEPVRLFYEGRTFRNGTGLQGKRRESTEIGAELMKDSSAEADAEMIALLIESLKDTGLKDFIVSIGDVAYYKGICEEAGIDPDTERDIRDAIIARNYHGLELIMEGQETGKKAGVFLQLSELIGGHEILADARKIVGGERALSALDRLEQVYEALAAKSLDKYISFDLGNLSRFNYYTGITFQAYSYGVGDAIARGGRYDELLSRFGNDAPAIGFMIDLDDLMSAIDGSRDGYLTIAIGKGRLVDSCVELFGKCGIDGSELTDKHTRKLIFTDEKNKLRFFLAKGPDVPTYVENGVADIGIVGKDTILEENRSVYEVLDLGFGKCRMCVCGPESARTLLDHRDMIRVATKYPVIAKDYFYNQRQQTVDIIKLNGSVELGPIVGLSDVIVDIVETGSTLKENGLTVLAEICQLSARVIVNQVSMQMDSARIRGFTAMLRSQPG